MRPDPKKPPIRLGVKEYQQLRKDCCKRAMDHCEVCGQWCPYANGHLDHYPKTRGAGAGDTLEEVRWTCYICHHKRHMGIQDIRP